MSTRKMSSKMRRQDERAAHSSPVVSVIIPAYNAASYIGDTLDSLMEQTFTDYETIIVNDGSPDTEELELVLESYRGSITYLTQENAGAGAARNRGLRAARGRYIAFLDADDLWLPNYLSEQLKFIQSGGYDFAYANALLFGDSPLAGRSFMDVAPSKGEVTFLSLIKSDCNIITTGVMASTEAILDAGLFDEENRSGSEDFDLWLRLSRRGARMAYHQKVLLRYRCHKGSLSGDGVNRVLRQMKVYDAIRTTYNLTSEESAEILKMMERLSVEMERETGKLHLLRGNPGEALKAFEKANRLQPNWKLLVAIWFLRVAPRLSLKLVRRKAATW